MQTPQAPPLYIRINEVEVLAIKVSSPDGLISFSRSYRSEFSRARARARASFPLGTNPGRVSVARL